MKQLLCGYPLSDGANACLADVTAEYRLPFCNTSLQLVLHSWNSAHPLCKYTTVP